MPRRCKCGCSSSPSAGSNFRWARPGRGGSRPIWAAGSALRRAGCGSVCSRGTERIAVTRARQCQSRRPPAEHTRRPSTHAGHIHTQDTYRTRPRRPRFAPPETGRALLASRDARRLPGTRAAGARGMAPAIGFAVALCRSAATHGGGVPRFSRTSSARVFTATDDRTRSSLLATHHRQSRELGAWEGTAGTPVDIFVW